MPADALAEQLDNSAIGVASVGAEAVRALGQPLAFVRTRRTEILPVYRRRLARSQRGEGPATEGLEEFVAFLDGPGEVWLATAEAEGRAFLVVLGDRLDVEAVTAVVR